MAKKREEWIDLVRGIAVILVVIGHCIQYMSGPDYDFWHNPVFEFIYSFHMQLFMLISGYAFYWSSQKQQSLVRTVADKIKRLLFPCGFWAAAGYVLWIVRGGGGTVPGKLSRKYSAIQLVSLGCILLHRGGGCCTNGRSAALENVGFVFADLLSVPRLPEQYRF